MRKKLLILSLAGLFLLPAQSPPVFSNPVDVALGPAVKAASDAYASLRDYAIEKSRQLTAAQTLLGIAQAKLAACQALPGVPGASPAQIAAFTAAVAAANTAGQTIGGFVLVPIGAGVGYAPDGATVYADGSWTR